MKEPLNSIAEIIAQANDKFLEQHQTINTLIGIIDQALRKQGTQADAITIDCPQLDKKIVFLLHDQQPSTIDVALGNKAGDINSSTQYAKEEITIAKVISLMTAYFVA